MSVVLGLPADRTPYRADVGLSLATRVGTAPTLVVFALTMVGSTAIAALSYRFVELPFLRRKEG